MKNNVFHVRFRYQREMKDDLLYIVKFFGSELFESNFARIILLSLLMLHTTVLIVQIVYFSLHPFTELLIQYGPLCLQLFWCQLNIIVLLLNHQKMNKIFQFIKFWAFNSAGTKTGCKIMKEIKIVKLFVLISIIVSLLWATSYVFSDDYKEYYVWGLLYKLTFYLTTFPMLSCGYQAVYITKNIRFQMYIFTKLAEDISFGFNKPYTNLIHDQKYQKEIEFRLKVLIKRHIDFLRWKNDTMKEMNFLILPFSIGGTLIFLSLMLYFFQFTEGFKTTSAFQTLTAVIGANSIFWGFINGGQNLEDESEKMYLAMMTVNWYTWNTSNRKLLLVVLCNLAQPIDINYKKNIAINYKLALQIFRNAYTAISFIYRTW